MKEVVYVLLDQTIPVQSGDLLNSHTYFQQYRDILHTMSDFVEHHDLTRLLSVHHFSKQLCYISLMMQTLIQPHYL